MEARRSPPARDAARGPPPRELLQRWHVVDLRQVPDTPKSPKVQGKQMETNNTTWPSFKERLVAQFGELIEAQELAQLLRYERLLPNSAQKQIGPLQAGLFISSAIWQQTPTAFHSSRLLRSIGRSLAFAHFFHNA